MEIILEGEGRRPESQTSPANSSPAREGKHLPAYVRLPKPKERCAWTGLSRTTLNELILGPDAPVKSVVVRREGASRGVRLISLVDLLRHLDGLPSDSISEEESQNGEDGRHE